MMNFIFMWRDENGNNAYFQVEAGSLPSAFDAFCKDHNGEYYAVIQGSNLEMREFIA